RGKNLWLCASVEGRTRHPETGAVRVIDIARCARLPHRLHEELAEVTAPLGSQQPGNPALHPRLIGRVLRSKLRAQSRLVGEHAAMEPDRLRHKQSERKPRPKGHG